jgi:hypothetical protein
MKSVPEGQSLKGQEDFRLRLLASVVSASHVTSAHFSADFSVNHQNLSDKKSIGHQLGAG